MENGGVSHRDVYVARQIIELIDDLPWWCREDDDHAICRVGPNAASWPEPAPLSVLDEEPGWDGNGSS